MIWLAYMYCEAPFQQPPSQLEDRLHWWKAREQDSGASILSVSATKLSIPTVKLTIVSRSLQ